MPYVSGESPNLNSELSDRFDRYVIMDNRRTVSRCKTCGVMIIVCVHDDLQARERKHEIHCAAGKRPASSRIAS
jgi:hypothetical protein